MGIMTATTTVWLSKPSKASSLTRRLSFCVDDSNAVDPQQFDVKIVDEDVEEVLSEWWGCRELLLEKTEPVVEEEVELAPILGLPDDVMTLIFAQLPRRSLAATRLVCSSWKRVAEQQEIALLRRKIGVAEGWIYVLTENSTFRAYDLASAQWTSLPPAPGRDFSEWQGFSTVALGHKLLVIGGTRTQISSNLYASTAVVSSELLIYNALTNKWMCGASMSTPRCDFAAAAVGDKVYVAGGQGNAKFLASAEVYDCASNTWTAIADLNFVRSSCRGFAIKNEFWIVAGEYNKRHERSSAEVYNAETNSWRVISNMYLDDKKVMEPAAIANGELVCIHQRRVMAYKTESNSWTQRGRINGGEDYAPRSCFTRFGSACESVGGRLFVFGGSLQNRYGYCRPVSSVEVCELDVEGKQSSQLDWKSGGDMGRGGGVVSASVVLWL